MVIVGNTDDPHVEAVLSQDKRDSSMVIDAATISEREFALLDGEFSTGPRSGPEQGLTVERDGAARGWIRRLAPPDWQRGLVVDSHDAAIKTSWLSLLVAAIRTCSVEWLTGIDALVTAENKLVQHETARRIGIATPETVVCSDAGVAREALGDRIILKALGPGHFYEGDDPYVVFTSEVSPDGPELDALASAPFIAQRKLKANAHLRVVTVGDRLWVGGISADNLPLDWRQDPDAHVSFEEVEAPSDVTIGALALASELGLGYSSQDWLLCDDGNFVVDVNPAGQWLFLPQPLAAGVTAAISNWLAGGDP